MAIEAISALYFQQCITVSQSDCVDHMIIEGWFWGHGLICKISDVSLIKVPFSLQKPHQNNIILKICIDTSKSHWVRCCVCLPLYTVLHNCLPASFLVPFSIVQFFSLKCSRLFFPSIRSINNRGRGRGRADSVVSSAAGQ